jgi:hypothetical protein
VADPTVLNLGGKEIPVLDVQIKEARGEKAFEYELEDGTVLRVRFVANSFYRVLEGWEGDGNPVYILRGGQSISLVKAGPRTKRPEK